MNSLTEVILTILLVLLAIAIPLYFLFFIVGLYGFMWVGGLMLFVPAVRVASRGRGRDAIAALELPTTVKEREKWNWLDFYASADPVPNGPLLDNASADLMDSIEVHNRGSALCDHTTYWDNRDHFVGAVACAVANLADIYLAHEEHFEIAKHRRRWRVQWLVAARWTFIIIALAMPPLLWRWDRLPSSASDLPLFLPQVPGWIADGIAAVSAWLPSMDVSVLSAWLQSHIVQFTAVAAVWVAALVGYFSLYAIWLWWEEREIGRFFSRKGFELLNVPLAIFLLFYELMVFAAFGWIFVQHELIVLPLVIRLLLVGAIFATLVVTLQYCFYFRRRGGSAAWSLYLAAWVVWVASFLLVFGPAFMWAMAERPSAAADDLITAMVNNPFWLAYIVVGSLALLVYVGGFLFQSEPFLRRWLEDWSYARL
jgi:hypothetical protein